MGFRLWKSTHHRRALCFGTARSGAWGIVQFGRLCWGFSVKPEAVGIALIPGVVMFIWRSWRRRYDGFHDWECE